MFEDEALSAERAFADHTAREGIRAAFLAVLAEDAMVLGEGPEPGRSVYEAFPAAFPGRLQWEPAVVGAAPDGTLAFTSGPYRLLEPSGAEKSTGVYFSVWRRREGSGGLELVLDFGARGAAFPDHPAEPIRLRVPEPGGTLALSLVRCPSLAGALRLGEPPPTASLQPLGCHRSADGRLAALWGARARSDGTPGAFIVMVAGGVTGPVVLAAMNA